MQLNFIINKTTDIHSCELCFMSKQGECIARKIEIAGEFIVSLYSFIESHMTYTT